MVCVDSVDGLVESEVLLKKWGNSFFPFALFNAPVMLGK